MNTEVSAPVGTAGKCAIRGVVRAGYLQVVMSGWPCSVQHARELLRRALGISATDELLICASELVTNAIEHSRSGSPGGHLVLCAQAEGATVLVSVLDGGPLRLSDPPAAVPPADEHGRGLTIIEALSEEWGWGDAFTGRRAWFRIKVSGAAAAETFSTPDRGAQRDAAETLGRDTTETLDRDATRDLVLAGRH